MRILSNRSRYAFNSIHENDMLANSMKKAGKKVIIINRGDPPVYFKTPSYIINAFMRALKEGKTGYSSAIGVEELREAVSKRQKRLYNVDSTSDDVIITQGVSEALMFLNASLINDGDRAVVFRPYYAQYVPELEINGGIPILERYSEEDNWSVDTDSLEKMLKRDPKITKRIKYVLITNPNNPTGTVLERKTLKEVVEIANDYDLLLISDEVYDEIIYNKAKFTSISELAKGVPHIILNGASKDYDSTGFRIGFVIIPENDRTSSEIKSKIKDFATLRLSANTPAQYAVAESMNNIREHNKAIKYMVKEIEERANLASRLINGSGYMHAVTPQGAFYIFPRLNMDRLRINDDKEFVTKFLKEECVQITRGSGFGEKGHIRIVLLPYPEILEDAIKRIERFCRRHSR